ncbi:MAG: hypothetical protein CMJ85_04930 [Planctomycetes bacterium]|nr:hypothetical protein [Planctomycetota bacterium]MDP6423187.1 enoyl-CoA hydratase-related protein [Planctomycetota bacterium]
MAYTFQGRLVRRVGVVGSGQIGPDIALFFAKVLSRDDVSVVVVDVAADALERGQAKLEKKVDRGEESGAFSSEWAAVMKQSVQFTTDYDRLDDADFIVEAATEDLELKAKIFAGLERRCRADTIFASNSSHLEPERIFEGLKKPERGLVIHYFFPAERNPVVEIVPSAHTDESITSWLLDFYENIGKVPIRVGSRYGYAIDPIFEGQFLAAALLAEQGVATPKQIDEVSRKALGLTIGPFTAMNLTGGNPITNVGLANYTSKIHGWYRSPASLQQAVADGAPWDAPKRGEDVDVPEEVARQVTASLRGAYLGICAEIVDSGVASVEDLDMAVELALDMKPPFRFMNKIGTNAALKLVRDYAAGHPDFPVPALLREHGDANRDFRVRQIVREDVDGVAVLKIRRPRVLNALNQAVFDELREQIAEVEADKNVRAVVLTGFGVKAFVSGADVKFLAGIETAEQGSATSLDSQDALNKIEACTKPVVCAYNGLAFGGGNELAMACHARIARAGLKVLAAQPEVNLGIIPGAGGTQRLPRLVGFEKAAELLRTGRPISAQEAHEIGLVRTLVDGDLFVLRRTAIDLALAIADGTETADKVPDAPMTDVPATLPEIDLRHLSRAVDNLVVAAILEGARLPLRDGLALEAAKFGEVCALEDMRIGVRNFLENGPRSKAEFVHA